MERVHKRQNIVFALLKTWQKAKRTDKEKRKANGFAFDKNERNVLLLLLRAICALFGINAEEEKESESTHYIRKDFLFEIIPVFGSIKRDEAAFFRNRFTRAVSAAS